MNLMLNSTKTLVIGLSAGIVTVLGSYLINKWLNNEETSTINDPQKPNKSGLTSFTLIFSILTFRWITRNVFLNLRITLLTNVMFLPSSEKRSDKKTCVPAVDYSKLAPAISTRNPQLGVLLKFINEKSAFKGEQVCLFRFTIAFSMV